MWKKIERNRRPSPTWPPRRFPKVRIFPLEIAVLMAAPPDFLRLEKLLALLQLFLFLSCHSLLVVVFLLTFFRLSVCQSFFMSFLCDFQPNSLHVCVNYCMNNYNYYHCCYRYCHHYFLQPLGMYCHTKVETANIGNNIILASSLPA